MSFIPLFFIFSKMYAFINYRELAFFIQNFSAMLQSRRNNPNKKHIILIDRSAFFFAAYFIIDIAFLLYCIWLMMNDATWQPGCLLLIISAMESYAMHARVSGTYFTDSYGFAYPKIWFRYLMSGQSIFILLQLFETGA